MLTALCLASFLAGVDFEVTTTTWDGRPAALVVPESGAILGWPGRDVTIRPVPGSPRLRPLFDARRRGAAFTLKARSTRALRFAASGTRGETREVRLTLLVPETLEVDSSGTVISPSAVRGYPLGLHPADPPPPYRRRASALARRAYIVTDTTLRISPRFTLGSFVSRHRPVRPWTRPVEVLSLDVALVELLERIQSLWSAAGYEGTVRVESPYRTPDYNDADAAGRAAFSLHMYGSACDIILSREDDRLHDDTDRDGDRDLDDLLPLARLLRDRMKDGRLPPGGIGVYRYVYRDGRSEEYQVHVDLRGRLVTWGFEYDSDTVKPSRRIAW